MSDTRKIEDACRMAADARAWNAGIGQLDAWLREAFGKPVRRSVSSCRRAGHLVPQP